MGQIQTVGCRATRVTRENGITTVRYHDTDIVSFDDVTITLRTGGWKTVTTKARMNQTSNQYGLGFYVSQKNFHWFVTTKAGTRLFAGRTLTLDRKTLEIVGGSEQ